MTAAVKKPYKKTPIPPDLRWAVWERDNFTCRNCGTRRYLTVDHIQPESQDGVLEIGNLQTLCKPCNSRKGPYRLRQLRLTRVVKTPTGRLGVRILWRCAGCGTENFLLPSAARRRQYCRPCASKKRAKGISGPRPHTWSAKTQEIIRLRQIHPDWTATAISQIDGIGLSRERVRQILKRAGATTEGQITVADKTVCPQCGGEKTRQRTLKRSHGNPLGTKRRVLCSRECRKAHYQHLPRFSKYDKDEAKIIELYQGGMDGTSTARHLNIPRPSVYMVLKRLGIPRRPKGGHRRGVHKHNWDMIWVEHQRTGEGAVLLSRRLGIPQGSISQVLAHFRQNGQSRPVA